MLSIKEGRREMKFELPYKFEHFAYNYRSAFNFLPLLIFNRITVGVGYESSSVTAFNGKVTLIQVHGWTLV